MAIFQSVPATAQVTIKNKLDGQDYVNTLYFRKLAGGALTQTDLQGLAAGASNILINQLIIIWPQVMVHQKIIARALDVQDSWVVENAGEEGAIGERVGNILPNNIAFSISFRTGLAGRTNNGRNSVGGLLEADVTGSMLNVIVANGIQDAYAAFIGAGTVAAGWQWCIVSRKVANPGDPATPRDVVDVTYADLVVDSQKTRLPGRGN